MFGFGKGKIEIQLDNFNYKPGDTIEGTVALTLKKPIEAKGVKIRIIGEQRQMAMMGANRRQAQVPLKILDFTQPLDGEKEYKPGDPMVYPFKIIIPKDLFNKAKKEGALGSVVSAMQTMQSMSSRTTFHLDARLDIPWKTDVSKKVQINITKE